jgi:hypothetical protein
MRHLAKPLICLVLVFLVVPVMAQEGKVIVERSITIPRDATFGDETLTRGSYRIALTDISGEMWFVVKKGGEEVARDISIEMENKDVPTSGVKAEILKGEEYYRVRVRRGDKVYLIHFLLKGGKA